MIAMIDWLQVAAVTWFTISTAARSIVVSRRLGRNPILLGPRHDGVGGLLALSEFITTNLWIALLLASVLPIDRWSLPALIAWRWAPPLWVRLAGVALIIGAFVLRQAAMRALGDSWRLGLDHDQPGPLVTSGPYAWSRNPIYLFFALWMLGAFLACGAWPLVPVGLASAVQLHALALQEELALRARFGALYDDYTRRVRRYLGARPQAAQAARRASWRASSRSR
jgi:protein-S-isoprenylcysteine O-methyltransferase Ste14